MKYLKQFGIIISVSLMGELLNELLPFSVPGSIYGLVLMLVALGTGLIKVGQVKETSAFLLDIMPVLFIPSTVGLMDYFGVLSDILVPVLLVCIFGTAIVMGVTGRVTQRIILAGGMEPSGDSDEAGTVGKVKAKSVTDDRDEYTSQGKEQEEV